MPYQVDRPINGTWWIGDLVRRPSQSTIPL